MTAARPKTTVTDAPDRERYEAHTDGQLAGVLEYAIKYGKLALIHTEVLPAFEGRGIGSTLVRFALRDARTRGLRVIASCPFVRDYLTRHPDEADIVVGHREAST